MPRNRKNGAPEERIEADDGLPDRHEILAFWAAIMRGEALDRNISREGVVTEVPPTLHSRLRASELLHAEVATGRAGGTAEAETPKPMERRKLYEVKSGA
jgi:hypothetical protein